PEATNPEESSALRPAVQEGDLHCPRSTGRGALPLQLAAETPGNRRPVPARAVHLTFHCGTPCTSWAKSLPSSGLEPHRKRWPRRWSGVPPIICGKWKRPRVVNG